jgi:hypothetical protein
MKKQLLATSALVAAGLIGTSGGALAQTAPASQPIQVTVGGYMYQFFGYVSQRDRGPSAAVSATSPHPLKFLQTSDSEIYFQGKTTLANGISLGMRIELEGNTESDQIDESFGYVEGAFGRIEAGSTFAAAFKMGYHGPEAVQSQSMSGVNALQANLIANPTSAYGAFDNRLANTAIRDGDDASDKVSYYTPRFEGFQVGVSYTPEQSQDSNHHIKFGSNTYNNEVSAAINFVRAFGPIDTAIYAGYQHANKPYGGTASNATLSDPQTYGFGAQVGYAGFRFGGSFTKAKNFVGIGGATTIQASPVTTQFSGATDAWDQGRTWDVGLTYTFGPAVVGAYYVDGRNKNGTGLGGGYNTENAFDVGGRYQLGPGVQVQAMVFHAKIHSAASSALSSQNATGIQTGFLLNF